MAKIGDYGTSHEHDEPDMFGWFGTDIRIDPTVSDLAFMDFMEAASTVDEESAEAAVLVKTFFREIIYEHDFAEFWRLARKHGQGVIDLLEVMAEVVEKMMDRPTQPSSDSQDGPSSTDPRSKDDSSSRAIAHLSGRPDLQLAVVRATEAQEAREARHAKAG